MKDHMARLAQIVKVDQEIQNLKEELDEIPIKVREVEDQLRALEVDYEKQKGDLEKARSELKRLQGEQEAERDHLQSKEQRLHAIKTQKEYQAVLKEISLGKTATKQRDDQIGQWTKTLEDLSQTLAPLEEKRKALQDSLAQEQGQIEGTLSGLQGKLKELEAKFNEQLLALPEDIRHKYRRVGEKRQPAAARVLRGTCQECFMSVPPQLYIEIQKKQEIHSCPNCHRLLYLEIE